MSAPQRPRRAAAAPTDVAFAGVGTARLHERSTLGDQMPQSPFRSSLADAPTRLEDEAGLFRTAPLVDPRRGSHSLLLGACWINPGCAPVEWTADADTHEVYYVLSGTVRVTWSGGAPGEATLGPQDALFLAPAWTYTVENAGADDVFLVYAMTPPPPHDRLPE